jgi:hypothetical protein
VTKIRFQKKKQPNTATQCRHYCICHVFNAGWHVQSFLHAISLSIQASSRQPHAEPSAHIAHAIGHSFLGKHPAPSLASARQRKNKQQPWTSASARAQKLSTAAVSLVGHLPSPATLRRAPQMAKGARRTSIHARRDGRTLGIILPALTTTLATTLALTWAGASDIPRVHLCWFFDQLRSSLPSVRAPSDRAAPSYVR